MAELVTAGWLQTRRLHLGPMDCQVPVHVRFGPIILVDVKANIIMPEVEVTPNHLHFGDVQRGCCKVNLLPARTFRRLKYSQVLAAPRPRHHAGSKPL